MSYAKIYITKVCKKCGVEKPIEDFTVNRIYKKSGVASRRTFCKPCYYEYCHIQRLIRKDKIKEYNNSPVAVNARKRYRDTHKQESRQYQIDHKDKLREYNRRLLKTEKWKKYGREYKKEKRKLDLNFKIYSDLKRRTHLALKGNPRITSNILTLWGCNVDFLKKYLESKFKVGMTWQNHSLHGWHIDHIIPCASFDLTDIEQQRKCFHYTNLQPLWAKDNLSKGAKLVA